MGISGTLHAVRGREVGTLTLDRRRNNLTLHLTGPVPSATSTAPVTFHFTIITGMALPTHGTAAFIRESGSGKVTLTLAPGTGRVGASLDFLSP